MLSTSWLVFCGNDLNHRMFSFRPWKRVVILPSDRERNNVDLNAPMERKEILVSFDRPIDRYDTPIAGFTNVERVKLRNKKKNLSMNITPFEKRIGVG